MQANGEWIATTHKTHITTTVFLIAGDMAGIVICTALLILSIVQHKEMFVYSTVLICIIPF